jgi:hypothetical protein
MSEYDPTRAEAVAIVRRGMKRPSSLWSDLKCPFCKTVTRAYHWSLAGGGKKCACGAKFDYYGNAVPPLGKVFNDKKRKFTK